MLEGDHVVTRVDLPGHPRGAAGLVREVGRFLIAVEFDDGQRAYYRSCQLQVVSAELPDAGGEGLWTPLTAPDSG